MNSFWKFFKGIMLRGETTDPTDNLNGSMWYNSTSNRLKGYFQSAIREVTTNDQTQTLTNKTVVVANNTVTTAASGNLVATELNAALAELQGSIDTTDGNLSTHIADTTTHGTTGNIVGTTDAQTLTTKTIVVANNTVTTAASGNLTATELNAALAELQGDIDTRATSSDLTTHINDTSTHGISSDIVGRTETQTLSNKTFSDPITLPEVATPTTPASGFGKIYFKTDGLAYSLNDSGTETALSGGGGGGANTTLSNLTSPTSVNQNIIPSANLTRTLGTSPINWSAVHTNQLQSNDVLHLVAQTHIDVHSFAVKNGLDPVDPQDLATKNYVDNSPHVARYTRGTSQSIATNTITIVDYATLVYDTDSAVTTGASWNFQPDSNGYYCVIASAAFANSGAWEDGERAFLALYKNGTLFSILTQKRPGAGAGFVEIQGSDFIQLTTSDTIDVRIFQDSDSSINIASGQPESNFISIFKIK